MGITKELRDLIVSMYANGQSCSEIAKKIGLPEAVVKHICRK